MTSSDAALRVVAAALAQPARPAAAAAPPPPPAAAPRRACNPPKDIRPALRQSANVPFSPWLPCEPTLRDELRAATGAKRRQAIDDYVAEVRGHRDAARAAGAFSFLSRHAAAAASRAADPKAPKPIGGLPGERVVDFRRFLEAPSGSRRTESGESMETQLGYALVFGDAAAATEPTPDDTFKMLTSLRRFDDVLCRATAAKRAASVTGAPLADVLALYRTEGDLAMPPSHQSLFVKRIPPGRFAAGTSLRPLPEIRHLVWIADKGSFEACTVDEIKSAAITSWVLHVAGLDDFVQRGVFVDWSSETWAAAGAASSYAAAAARWTVIRAEVSVAEAAPQEGGAARAYIGLVRDPIAFVFAILVEGIQLLRAVAAAGSLVEGKPLRPFLAYAHYNLQRSKVDGRSGEAGFPMPKMQAFVLSALHAARASGSKELRDAIAASRPLRGVLAQPSTPQIASEEWETISAWLAADDGLDLLSAFVETATPAQWPFFQKPRGNASRYVQLRDYYERLTT